MKFQHLKSSALCLILFAFMLNALTVSGQKQKEKQFYNQQKAHSPKTATLLSTFIPGAGQAYNHKYWKIPVIYAWAATHIYFVGVNNRFYQRYRRLYEQKVDTAQSVPDRYENVSAEIIKRKRENWRRNRDLNYIGLGVLYFLQIIDANVDAHLYEYDISDDLTFHYQPYYRQTGSAHTNRKNQGVLGMHLSLSF